jgi:hypothetical protein
MMFAMLILDVHTYQAIFRMTILEELRKLYLRWREAYMHIEGPANMQQESSTAFMDSLCKPECAIKKSKKKVE